jgi:hypothetical protein
MNSKQNNKSQDQDTEKLKEIPKWTRKYAQNRTLTPFVLIVMICLISVGIGFPLGFAIAAFRKGNMTLAGAGIALLVAVPIFSIIFSLKFGGKNRGAIDQKIDQWIYGEEGTASMQRPKLTKKKKWLDFVVALVVFVCIIGSYHLTKEGFISFKYLQPVTALYFVPFLVFQYSMQRPRLGPLLLICPTLCTIHAILIIVGIPIFFTGSLGILNQFLPLFAYTFLAYIIAHIYSRYALKKLKTAAHLQEDTNEQ